VEQVDELCVGKDVPAEKAIRKMAIGEVKPQEEDDEDCKLEETTTLPPTANLGVSGEKSGHSGFSRKSGEKSEESEPDADTSQGSQEIEDLIQQEVSDPHPRVRQSVQRDHPIDNILGSIRRGVTTHSRLANFCEHYSTSRDVVINDVTLTSLKMSEWSQLVFCDDFVLITVVASHLFIGDEFGFSVIDVSPICDEFCVVMDLNSFYDKRFWS
jgi:hypothetical protein